MLSADSGEVRPERLRPTIGVAFGATMIAFNLFALSLRYWEGFVGIFVGLAILSQNAPLLGKSRRVAWSRNGVDGPSRTPKWAVGPARTSIAWSDIRAIGCLGYGYWFIETGDGRRIYWNRLYNGYGAFVDYLQRERPDLALPANLKI
jgi:hypothetical protein